MFWPKCSERLSNSRTPVEVVAIGAPVEHIFVFGFQLSHLSCERATIEKGQQQAAEHRERRQERRDQKRAGTNSKPACVGGDANSPPPPRAHRPTPPFVR